MKIIIFALGGRGTMGHINVASIVANQCLLLNAEITCITDYDIPDGIFNEKIHLIKVPNASKKKSAGFAFGNVDFADIMSITENLKPDIMIFESFFPSDIDKYSDSLVRVKKILLLSCYIDQTLLELEKSKYFKIFDSVILLRDCANSNMGSFQLSLQMQKKGIFFGPIIKRFNQKYVSLLKKKYKIKPDDFLVVVTAGGGGYMIDKASEAEVLFDEISKYFKIIADIPHLKMIFLSGPFIDIKTENKGIIIEKFEPNFFELIHLADLVVCRGGVNTVNEILSAKTPVIIIPAPRMRDDQYARAKAASKKENVHIVSSIDGKKIAQKIVKLYQKKSQQKSSKDFKIKSENDLELERMTAFIADQKYGQEFPLEVMIEVEPRCNLNCEFCFNKISFAKRGRNDIPLSFSYVKKIIDEIARVGIKIVRFTGGEPLLRKDLFSLMWYAKSKGLEVRLNTNGTLVTKTLAQKIGKLVDNVLIPMESGSELIEGKITGRKNIFNKKIQAIKFLKQAGVKVVRVGSVGTAMGVKDFEKMAEILFKLPISEWEWYRPVSTFKEQNNDRKNILLLINKLLKFRKITDIKLSLANAFPFCAGKNINETASICVGAYADDGNSRLVIDPRGFVKPHYFVEKNIGDPLDILGAWNHPYMKKKRSLAMLPTKCKKCLYVTKCLGGSRHEAKMAFGSEWAPDPLMKI